MLLTWVDIASSTFMQNKYFKYFNIEMKQNIKYYPVLVYIWWYLK